MLSAMAAQSTAQMWSFHVKYTQSAAEQGQGNALLAPTQSLFLMPVTSKSASGVVSAWQKVLFSEVPCLLTAFKLSSILWYYTAPSVR